MPVSVECRICGKSVLVAPTHAAKRKFCSPECREVYKWRTARNCQYCGELFRVPPYRIKHGLDKFCGQKCYGLSQHRPLAERFWEKVNKNGPIHPVFGQCWEWIGFRTDSNYGRFKVDENDRGDIYAHRLAWELVNGDVPADLKVLHHCDNPPCVRAEADPSISHLWLGTQRDNTEDRDSKDRVRHGETHANARLTLAQVRYIREIHGGGLLNMEQLALAYGVNPQTISDLISGKTWKRA